MWSAQFLRLTARVSDLKQLPVCLSLSAILWSSVPVCAGDEKPSTDPDSRGRSTAVALNYCRASFHRIRQNPSKRVMLEEQEKILNNLNLDGIADEAVIKLYTEVLDEVAQIEIAERETTVLTEKYKKTLHRKVGVTALSMAAQMATLSMERVVYTGVNSWLDYRDMKWTREFDTWKVEKNRINAVVSKSSRFLDTFWKLTQSKNIPDRWLVRGKDLDDLTEAIQESDLQKRLRILKRMEPFMECYPPYWYYVARTQQGLGDFYAASETYDRLADLGHGHFRRDDMLAASLANLAVIQAFLKQPGSDRTAREALAHSPDVWQANLMAAQVLEQHGHTKEAEDAILRNIDVDLEATRSRVALVGLYYRQNRMSELADTLASEDMLQSLPVLSIVQAAAKLGGTHPVPPAAIQRIRESLRVAVDSKFGNDDLIIACDPIWQSEMATVRVALAGQAPAVNASSRAVRETHPSGETVLRFRGAINGGNPLRPAAPQLAGSRLTFEFPPSQARVEPLVVVLGEPVKSFSFSSQATVPWWPAASPTEVRYGTTGLNLMRPNLVAAKPQPDRRAPRVTILGVRVRDAAGDPRKPLDDTGSGSEPREVPPPPDLQED